MSTATAAAAGVESGASRLRDVGVVVSASLAYLVVARVNLWFAHEPTGIAAVWLPAGIFLSSVVLAPRRVRHYLVGALLLANAAARGAAGTPLAASLIYSVALAADVWLATWLIERSTPAPFSFRGVRDLAAFLLAAVVLSNVLTSSLAAAEATSIPGTSFGHAWLWWAASKGIGTLLVTPFLVSWARPSASWGSGRTRRDAAEMSALVLALVALHYTVLQFPSGDLHSPLLYAYLTFPLLLWAAFRLDFRGTSAALMVLAASTVPIVTSGRESLVHAPHSSLDDLLFTQLSLAAMAVPPLFLTALVTERRRVEATLRTREGLLNKAEEIAHVGSWQLDVASGRLTWSDEVYRIFALSRDVVPTYRVFLEAVHPDDRYAVDAAYTGSIRERQDAYEIEHRIVRAATGEVRHLHEKCEHVRDASGRVVRSVGMVHDVTEHRRSEEAFSRLSRQNEEALKVAKMGVWEFEVASGLFSFNDQYFALHGTTAAAMGGRRMSAERFARELVHPDDAHLVRDAIERATATTDPDFQFETRARILRADGEVRNVVVWFRVEKNARGDTVRLHGVNQDVTTREQAEAELVRFNRAATDRELRMIELKREINELCRRVGEGPRHRIDFAGPAAED